MFIPFGFIIIEKILEIKKISRSLFTGDFLNFKSNTGIGNMGFTILRQAAV